MHGSNVLPFGPPPDNRALTRCDTESRSRICQVSLGLDHAACTPCVPPAVQTVQTGPIGGGSQMVQIEVGSGNRCVSHLCVCTVTGSTLRASQRQAAVCRRSWMRRPCAMEAHASVRLNAEACSRCPEEVTQRSSSASRPAASNRTRGSTRSATRNPPGSARLRALDLHTFRLGPLHHQDRQRNFDEVANPHGTQL